MKPAWLRYVLHAVVWVFLYFFPQLLSFADKPAVSTLLAGTDNSVHLISFLLLVGFSYVHYYWLVPRFYFGRHYLLYAALLALCLAVVIKLPQLITPLDGGPPDDFAPGRHEMPHRGGPDGGPGDGPGGPSILSGMTYNIILFFVSTFIAVSIQQRLQLFRIEKEKLNAELSFLKAQINPHFLFNTLNSIYALSLQKSDEAPKAIIQLSELMRYLLKDADAAYVSLGVELNYINNYIALQRRRLGHTVQIDYLPPQEPAGQKIAPLVLMSFVENAFKHGVNPDQESAIFLSIAFDGSQLRLLVTNNKVDAVNREAVLGIGLKNAQSRLEHLYPGKHELRIDDAEKTFTVHLTINLA